MAFTAGEVTNIANAQLDYYLDKGDVWRQTLQKRPAWTSWSPGRSISRAARVTSSVAVSGAFGAGGVNDTPEGLHPQRHRRVLYAG